MSATNCPRCNGKGLGIVWGLPAPEALEEAERSREVVLGGCCIDPSVTHECERCRNRWNVDESGLFDGAPSRQDGAGGSDDRELWVVGDLDGALVLSAEEFPAYDAIVWLEGEPDGAMTLEDFDTVAGECVVGWLAEPEPYEPAGPTQVPGEPAQEPPSPSVWLVGELAGQRILSHERYPGHDDEVWLEFSPRQRSTVEAIERLHREGAIGWFGESEPYELRIPHLVDRSRAAAVLGCSEAELEQWRRDMLPAAPRSFYGQHDNEFRIEEVIAVAVARWLRRWRTHTGDGFAARLALAPPPGKDWCVFREGP